MYRAEIRVSGRLVAILEDSDNGDLESQINAKVAELNAAQQNANLFEEIRVRYV